MRCCLTIWLLACVWLVAEDGDPVALPEDIVREVAEAEVSDKKSQGDFLSGWSETRENLLERFGLSWTVSYDQVSMAVAGGDGVQTGVSGDFTLQGYWAPAYRWSGDRTQLRFRLRHRHAYFGTPASALSGEVGALWGLVDGFTNGGFEIPDFFLRHNMEDIGLELRYGQMSVDSQFSGHQLGSSKKFFLNQGFSGNPGVAYPRFGAGLTAMQSFDNGLSLGFAVTTVQGTQNGDQVDFEFGSDDLFHALQFRYDYKNAQGLDRRLQLVGWHSSFVEDAQQPEGQGIQLGFEGTLDSEGTLFFCNLSWAGGGATLVDQFVSAGLGRPLRDRDFVGVAAGIGRGSGSDSPIQTVIEGFYRWQPTERLRITPDVQLLIGEDLNGGPGIRAVAGLRLSARF